MSIYNGINVCKDENDYEFIPDDKDAEPAETNTGKLNIKILEGFDDDDKPKIKTITEEGVTPIKIQEDVNRNINDIVERIKIIQKNYISDSKYFKKTTDGKSNRVILLEYKGQLTTLYRKLNAVNKYLKKPNAYKDLLCDFNKKYNDQKDNIEKKWKKNDIYTNFKDLIESEIKIGQAIIAATDCIKSNIKRREILKNITESENAVKKATNKDDKKVARGILEYYMNQIRQYIPHGGNSAPLDVDGKLQDEYNATKILHQAKKTLETTGKKK